MADHYVEELARSIERHWRDGDKRYVIGRLVVCRKQDAEDAVRIAASSMRLAGEGGLAASLETEARP